MSGLKSFLSLWFFFHSIQSNIHSCSFNRYLLCIYLVPSIAPDPRDRAVNNTSLGPEELVVMSSKGMETKAMAIASPPGQMLPWLPSRRCPERWTLTVTHSPVETSPCC